MSPIKDDSGSLHTGLEIIPEGVAVSDEVKDKASGYLNVGDGDVLDLSNDFDLLRYARCLLYSEFTTKRTARTSGVLFWLFDEYKEAVSQDERADKTIEALEFVKELTDSGMRDACIFLGYNTANMNMVIIRSTVKQEAINEPDNILRYKHLGNREQSVFAQKIISYRIARKEKHGYTYKGEFLGHSHSGIMSNIFKESNTALLNRLSRDVELHENPNADVRRESVKDTAKDMAKKEVEGANKQVKISSMLLEYYKLTHKDYDGDMSIKALERAIALAKEKAADVDKFSYESLSDKAKEFVDKNMNSSVAEIKRNLKLRKLDEKSFADIEDKDVLIQIGINHIEGVQAT